MCTKSSCGIPYHHTIYLTIYTSGRKMWSQNIERTCVCGMRDLRLDILVEVRSFDEPPDTVMVVKRFATCPNEAKPTAFGQESR